MVIFEIIVLGLSALFLAWFALVMNVENSVSRWIFKVIPCGIAVCLAFLFLVKIGFLIPPMM